MTNFEKLWNEEVKELANACILDSRLVNLMSRPSYCEMTQEEQEYMAGVSSKYKDACGMYHISLMIWKIEHALAHNRPELARFMALEIFKVLDSETYIANVFKNDFQNEECKTRIALRDGLKRLLSIK